MAKIKRLNQQEKIFCLIKGIYVDDKNEDCLSYPLLSLLPLYPFRVYQDVSWTDTGESGQDYLCHLGKREDQDIPAPFGIYSFRDVPVKGFQLGVTKVNRGNRFFYRASKEKAFCDRMYIKPPVYSVKQLRQLLFEDRRIDVDRYNELNKDDLLTLAPYYRKRNLMVLRKRIERVKKTEQCLKNKYFLVNLGK